MQRVTLCLWAMNHQSDCSPVSTKRHRSTPSPSFPWTGLRRWTCMKQQQGMLKNQHFRPVNPSSLTCEEKGLTLQQYWHKSHRTGKQQLNFSGIFLSKTGWSVLLNSMSNPPEGQRPAKPAACFYCNRQVRKITTQPQEPVPRKGTRMMSEGAMPQSI